jgi:hypothetical protein
MLILFSNSKQASQRERNAWAARPSAQEFQSRGPNYPRPKPTGRDRPAFAGLGSHGRVARAVMLQDRARTASGGPTTTTRHVDCRVVLGQRSLYRSNTTAACQVSWKNERAGEPGIVRLLFRLVVMVSSASLPDWWAWLAGRQGAWRESLSSSVRRRSPYPTCSARRI